METVKKNKLLLGTALCCSLLAFNAAAKEIDTNTAQMQAMDKITGKVSLIEVPVNGNVLFGSFSIVVRACKTRPPEETPENFAFVDVVDDYNSAKPVNIFRGWMMSSTPALNPVEHPIYDVWLLKCTDRQVDKNKLLSAEQLKERDSIEKAPKTEPLKVKTPEKASEDEVKESVEPVEDTEGKTVSDETDVSLPQEPNPEFSEERKLDDSAIVNPEPLIENEVQDIQEDGAPKSLLNIGNFNTEPNQETVSDDVEKTSVELTAPVVEEVIINQETGQNASETSEETIESQEIILEEPEETLDMVSDRLKN